MIIGKWWSMTTGPMSHGTDGNFRKNTIRDIAVATGANVFDTEEMGLTLEKGQLFDLGEIGEVIVTKVGT